MKKAWTIAVREFNSYLDSLSGYILLVLFLGISGFFTWLASTNVFSLNQADLIAFFSTAFWTLFFFVPAMTMRTFAEEQQTGTLEILLTHPVSYWEVVIGKFLGVFMLILLTLALTLPYYLTVSLIGEIDHGATLVGYLGLILLSASYISIGILASTLSKNQIVAFLIALGIGIFFQLIFDVLAQSTTGWLSEFFSYLSFRPHFETMARGVIDTKDLIFFLSFIFIGLALSVNILVSRRYK